MAGPGWSWLTHSSESVRPSKTSCLQLTGAKITAGACGGDGSATTASGAEITSGRAPTGQVKTWLQHQGEVLQPLATAVWSGLHWQHTAEGTNHKLIVAADGRVGDGRVGDPWCTPVVRLNVGRTRERLTQNVGVTQAHRLGTFHEVSPQERLGQKEGFNDGLCVIQLNDGLCLKPSSMMGCV